MRNLTGPMEWLLSSAPSAAVPRAALLLLAMILLPGPLALAGVMSALISTMGCPTKASIAAGLAAGALSVLPSCLLTVVAAYIIFKTVLLGKPLFNARRWRRRLDLGVSDQASN